jgi:flagellar M-ring protein FliF
LEGVKLKDIFDNLATLGRTRLLALGSIGLGMVFALVFGVGTALSPTFVPLYNNLSASTASQLVNTLEQAGFKVKLSEAGSTINVAQNQIPRARMALADNGLPNEGTPGWELFDQSTGLGMNSFMQKINRLRALEGELARSIQSLNTVEAARVHLVLPEREAFSRNKPDPSASVIVRSNSNAPVSRRQALAIRSLVAAAVPEMASDKVVVISSNGEIILGDSKSNPGGVTLETVKAGIEDRLANNIADILTARVGAGNARVQVAVSLNHERKVTKAQNFNPDQQVVRSTESSEETSSDGTPGGGTVDIANNLPDNLGGSTSNSAVSSETALVREVVNYEIGSSNTETVREAGEIERISVAVLINGIRTVDQSGNATYEDRSPDELDRLRRLIESASGINLDRGDSISIDSLQFVDYGADSIDPVGVSFGQMLSENLASILRGLFALGLIAAVLMLGVRPTLRLMLEAPKLAAEPALLDAGYASGNSTVKLADNASATPMIPEAVDSSANMLPPLISSSGSLGRQRIDAFTNIVEQEPEESMKIINHWLAERA